MQLKKAPIVAGLATLVCATSAVNGPVQGSTGLVPQAAENASTCALEPSGHRSDKHEWLSCLSVSASLDRLPAVGQTARLTVQVQSAADLSANVSIELPPNLTWVQVPSAMSEGTIFSARPETRGKLAKASVRREFTKGGAATYTGIVRATDTGPAQIRAGAIGAYAGHVEAGSDDVFLTIGANKATKGVQGPAVAGTVRVPSGAQVADSERRFRSVGTNGLGKPIARTAGAPCDTRVAGSWVYQDQTGAWRASRNLQVQVWDDDTFNDSLLAVGVTNDSGAYNVCFDSQSDGFPDSGRADVYVKFVTENSQWRVQRGGNPLSWQTGVNWDVPTGSTLNLGNLTTGDPTLHRGLHAFDAANDAWQWIPKPRNLCFDQDDSTCRQLRINWAPDSTDGTYYSLGANDVHLAADDPNAPMTVVHEIGHAVMDDVYNDAYPASPNCNPHSIQGASSAGCAWTEGWAEWFPATVYNDPFYRWPNGASLNLESAGWGNGWSNGDTTEGRVAGALIDLTDSANESSWDRVSEGRGPIWNLFMNNVTGSFGQFWSQRAASGGNVSQSALATLFNNTIDYGFRDPMANYAQLTRPHPSTPHNYAYNTTSSYWSVIAVRPNAGSAVDLNLYDNFGQSAFLRSSNKLASIPDFIAVDSNRRPLGDYYPRVFGTGSYVTELAQGSSTLPVGSQSVFMGASDIAVVRDVFLTGGVRNTFRVVPGNSSQDPSLFLFGSTANSATWIKNRDQASRSANSRGAGGAESFSVTAATSGWYGLVLVQSTGSGTYSLRRTQPAAAAQAVEPRKGGTNGG